MSAGVKSRSLVARLRAPMGRGQPGDGAIGGVIVELARRNRSNSGLVNGWNIVNT